MATTGNTSVSVSAKSPAMAMTASQSRYRRGLRAAFASSAAMTAGSSATFADIAASIACAAPPANPNPTSGRARTLSANQLPYALGEGLAFLLPVHRRAVRHLELAGEVRLGACRIDGAAEAEAVGLALR